MNETLVDRIKRLSGHCQKYFGFIKRGTKYRSDKETYYCILQHPSSVKDPYYCPKIGKIVEVSKGEEGFEYGVRYFFCRNAMKYIREVKSVENVR